MRILFITIILIYTSFGFGQEKYGFINLDDDSPYEFEVFGDSLDKYQVYFTGENHMYASFNTKFQFKLLTYLYKTQNVRHFIFEQSPGVSYIIEQIIIHDKTSHLLYLKDMFYEPFYYLVKDLRKFNDTLAMEEKIHIHGIDVERFPYFSVYALNHIADKMDKKSYGGEVFEQITALATSEYEGAGAEIFYAEDFDNFGFGFGDVSAWESLSSIIESAEKYKDSLTVALGDDSTAFYSILKSLELGREWYISERKGDIKSPIIRERFMADEFEKIYKKDQASKYYGQFGRCHLHKDQKAGRCYDYYMNSIANRINELDTSLANKVLVIPIFYTTSKEFDYDVVKQLQLKEKFMENGQNFIIDLAYKNGDHPIVGFYSDLPFVIVCNENKDESVETIFSWQTTIEEYHLGAYYGYHYFTKINKLNNALTGIGEPWFTDKFETWTFAMDYMAIEEQGARASFNYYPEMSNGGRFSMKGYLASIGSYYPFGNKFLLGSIGMDYGYGKMFLKEETDNAVPNLIQDQSQNLTYYYNDVFILDPNVEFRLTLPVISLNIKAGYAFDISGKYWRLNGKMKEFNKTSFTSPYIQIGASLNFKTES